MALRICEIDSAYTTYLHQFDRNVSLEHPGGARKFIGVVFEIDEKSYFAPMSSPKPRHSSISPTAPDVYKIDDGKLGIVNLNNMIPVPSQAVISLDISDIQDQKYKSLLTDQARFFHRDEAKIAKKALRLHSMISSPTIGATLKARCCNFRLLEEKCNEYMESSKKEATT